MQHCVQVYVIIVPNLQFKVVNIRPFQYISAVYPRTPDFVDSVFQDSEEEEIFFGAVSIKEQTGTFAK